MAGWETASRPDLTGPFTATSNTSPNEKPMPPSNLQAGYRQTIGNPGEPGLNTVRTILDLFQSPDDAESAKAATIQQYVGIGFTKTVDPTAAGLSPDAAAREGSNVQTAPDFAQGTASQAVVFLWRRGNLLLIQIDGGDSGWSVDAAAKWVTSVDSNARGAAS